MENKEVIEDPKIKISKPLVVIIKMTAALANKRKTNPELDTYILPQLELLSNLINPNKDPVLDTLKSKFQEMMLTYIFYMEELVKDQLDFKKYEEYHEMLVFFNKIVQSCVKNKSFAELYGIVK